MNKSSERGSAIIMLFVAVALFGMIAYTFMQGSRSNVSMITGEANKAAATQSQDCANVINMATKRLSARGCAGIVSLNADGSNTNPGAPTDGSCSVFHPNGGGAKPCNSTAVVSATCTVTNPGEICPDGSVFVGVVDGRRIYTTAADSGTTTWNNGSTSWVITNSISANDGLGNTNTLIGLSDAGAPYAAATLCRALGSEWYLPTSSELLEIYNQKSNIGGLGSGFYWTSEEETSVPNRAMNIRFNLGAVMPSAKNSAREVRCVRRD